MKLTSSKTTAAGRRGALRWLVGGLMGVALAGPVASTTQAQWFGNWWRSAAAEENVYETLKSKSKYSTLVAAIDAAELQDAVATLEDITVFAPNNRAFAAIPAEDLGALLEDKEALTQVLLYHVLGVRAESRDVESGAVETLLEGESVQLRVKKYWGGRYRRINVNDARVVDADVGATNGVIHGINSVLEPGFEAVPTLLELAAGDPNFSVLAGLVEQAGLAGVLAQDYRKLTVFAPTNEAFEAVPEEALAAVASDPRQLRKVLLNHLLFREVTSSDLESGTIRSAARLPLEVVVSDSGITIGGANAGPADIEASNGVLHVIDAVLLPAAPKSIVDVAQSREDLGTLVTALGVAGLVDTFDSTKRYPAYTVFAPNNDAFGALPEGALDALVADPEALGGVLALHVVPGRLEAKRLRDGQKLRTLSGDRLEVSVGDDGVKINGVAVVEADLKAENGVIHVIGGVLADEP
ncbi:MAG: fasciclin domain-containing protein, partial [Verrucomicrobiales bacterium]|nr:fasciclin domain-containing protein [Verrucomicrobiales bacterium]